MTSVRSLDGLRAAAALLVMLGHFSLNSYGWIGVEAFFVLSGYLITAGLMLEKKSFSRSVGIKRFFVKRVLRIFPLYFGYLICLTLVYFAFRKPEGYLSAAASLWLFAYNFISLSPGWIKSNYFSHLWTISIETQFYLIWPFVVYYCTEKKLKLIVIAMLLLAPLARFILGESLRSAGFNSEEVGHNVYWFSLGKMDALASGACAAVFAGWKNRRRLGLLLSLTILATGFLGVLNYGFTDHPSAPFWFTLGYPINGTAHYQHVWSYTAVAICLMTVVAFLSNPKNDSSCAVKFLAHPALVWLGKRSYGIYVYHCPLLAVMISIGLSPMQGNALYRLCWFVPYFISAVLIAQLSYAFLEEPFLKWKRQLSEMTPV